MPAAVRACWGYFIKYPVPNLAMADDFPMDGEGDYDDLSEPEFPLPDGVTKEILTEAATSQWLKPKEGDEVTIHYVPWHFFQQVFHVIGLFWCALAFFHIFSYFFLIIDAHTHGMR